MGRACVDTKLCAWLRAIADLNDRCLFTCVETAALRPVVGPCPFCLVHCPSVGAIEHLFQSRQRTKTPLESTRLLFHSFGSYHCCGRHIDHYGEFRLSDDAVRQYYMLMKPGIVFGNAVTAMGGFVLASRAHVDFWLMGSALVGLSLIVASGCVMNNYFDRVSDRKMARTRSRALAKGVISERSAILFGASLFLLGVFCLALFTNLLATWVAIFGFIVYVGFYTMWKYRTVYGTEIGSIAGAVPPVVGYCAVTNHFDLAAGLLFSIVALWQMPHFFAIAVYRMEEYASASIPVLPLKRGIYETKVRILYYVLAFIAAASLLMVFGFVGYWYLLAALLLGFGWLWICIQGFKAKNDRHWARQVFLFSLIVILGLCATIAIDVL